MWGGGGQNSWVFSAIPHLELGKAPLPKGLVLGQISVLNRPPLMLLMLVVSWPRCLGVSADAADAGRIVATLCVLLKHSCSRRAATCLSVYVWRKVGLLGQSLLTCRSLCVAMCSYVGTHLLVLTCYVGSKLLPPVLFSATFCLLQCGLAPAASLSWQLQ